MPENKFPELRDGLNAQAADGIIIGRVREVFRDVGTVESFGSVGIPPQQQDEGFDPVNYSYSEGAPGAGDDYFTVDSDENGLLYIPLSGVHGIEADRVVLAIDSDDIGTMGWDVRPDVLSGLENEYPKDGGAEPQAA